MAVRPRLRGPVGMAAGGCGRSCRLVLVIPVGSGLSGGSKVELGGVI